MNQIQGMNNLKKQKGADNIQQIHIQNQRNNSGQRNNVNKYQIQQLVNNENSLRCSQDSENIQFNVNRIQQGANCQIQYFFPQSGKNGGKNQTPLNEQKLGAAVNQQNKQSGLSQVKNQNNDFKISQVEYCEVELNLLQKRENPKKNISSSVSQSAAVKNIKDLLSGQQRSSSSKAIRYNNNICKQQINNEVNNDGDNDQLKKIQKSENKRQAKTPKIGTQHNKQQLTPSIERKKISSSAISNQRKVQNINSRDNVATEGSQKKCLNLINNLKQGRKSEKLISQQNKQSEFRLPCKSSLQNNRKYPNQIFKQYRIQKFNRIKTVGNEEDEEDDEYLQENFNLNDLDDNISPMSRFNEIANINKKREINDRYSQTKNQQQNRLKHQRNAGRVLENIQQSNNLQQIQSKRGQQQLQSNDNITFKENEDKNLSKINSSVGRQKKIQDDQNQNSKQNYLNGINRVILLKMVSNNLNKEIQNENNVVEILKKEISEESNRPRINSSSAIRKRIITKSNEKIKQNLSINIDTICDTYQDSSNNAKVGPALTTFDSKGSTKNTNTIKFSSLIESQSSSCTQNKIISNNFNNNNFSNASKIQTPHQAREYRIKTEGGQISHVNNSPYNPKASNNQILPLNKIDEQNNFVQATPSTINWSQASSTKSYTSFGVQFSYQKGKQNIQIKNNADSQRDNLGMLNYQPFSIKEINQTETNNISTSPQFLKLRFKNTSSIIKDKNQYAEDNKGRTNSELSNTLRQPKKKLMIKTINPYKSEEKRELSSQFETPQSFQNSLLMSSIGNNLFRKSHDESLPKSPISVKKLENNIKNNINQQLRNSQFSSNLRESINSECQITDNFQITLQNSTSSANKKHIDWIELTSPDNVMLNSLNNNSLNTDGINNNKKQKLLLRPTRVTSNERKNNNKTNDNKLLINELQSNCDNILLSDKQQQDRNSNLTTQNLVNELRSSSGSFKISELYDKKSSQFNLASSTQNYQSSGNNFNEQFFQSKINENKDVQNIGQLSDFTQQKQVDDLFKQKNILESIKSDAIKNMLRQSIEKGKEQIQQQQQQNCDSIFELQKDIHELKLSVQIENMNQNFATLNKNLKELNNNLNLEYSQIEKVQTQYSQSNILDNIESYHFDKNYDNEENQKSMQVICNVSILNNHQDSFKINENTENQTSYVFMNRGEVPSQNFQQHIQNHNIDLSTIKHNDDKDIMSQIEREKAEFEQKLLEEKIKFEQRQQELQQEYMNSKQKLLQQKQFIYQMKLDSSEKQMDEKQTQQQINNNLIQDTINNDQNIVKQNSQNIITSLNSGQKIHQFTNQSIDLSYIKNPNLENEVSKLFKQDQISQILPGSSCSFLSECENLLETSNQMFANNQQNIQQQMNLDEISILNTNNNKSQNDYKYENQQATYQQEIYKSKKQNYFIPINSQEIQSQDDNNNQNNFQNFPNININQNMVNIPKQIQKNNSQNIQQQSIIEEQDCEQSSESLIKQHSNKNINQNPQIQSNRMPPLPLNVQNNLKYKRNSLQSNNQYQQQQQVLKEISSHILKENKIINGQQIYRKVKILNRQSYNSNERIQTDPDQCCENNKKDEDLNINNQFFQNEIQKRGRKQLESPNKIKFQNNQKQLRVMTEPDDEDLEQEEKDNTQQIKNATCKNNRNKIISLQRNCQSVLNNQKQDQLSVKHLNERNINQFIVRKGDSLIKYISESTKNQHYMKLDKNNLFQADQSSNSQLSLNNGSYLQNKKGMFNLHYKKFQSQHKLEELEDIIN